MTETELKEKYGRFVESVAKRYMGKGLTLEELTEAGMHGLIVANQSFEPGRGFKLISYSIWYINQGILLALKACGSEEGKRLFEEEEAREQKIREFDDKLRKGTQSEEVSDAISKLDLTEQKIILLTYGFGCKPSTDKEICKTLGLTMPQLLHKRSILMIILRKQFM